MPSIAQLAITHFEKTGGAPAATAVLYRGKLWAAPLACLIFIAVWRQDDKWTTRALFEDHNLWNPGEVER